MFQIPDDDDDEFWNDIPLDIGHQGQSSSTDKENRPAQLRIPHAVSIGNPSEKLSSELNRGGSVKPGGKDSSSIIGSIQQNTDSRNETSPVSISTISLPKSTLISRSRSLETYCAPSEGKQSEMSTTASDLTINNNLIVAKQVINNSEGNSLCAVVDGERVRANRTDRVRARSGDYELNDYITPKRRRKFPGPAGILPKLGPGKSLDALSPSILNPSSPDVSRSTEDDSVVPSSQTSDDLFNDSAWQALCSDLNEDGWKLLRKFSITSTLHKAGKKQLHQGKAGLIFGIIESVESHGSEASVNIRDTSGRMQGTIHRELLKEYETELQTGTALVLKQVSIISLSNRNHYLNITPNNIVALYYVRQDTLKSRMFHGSQDSLCSVLSALEKKADANQNSLNSSLTTKPPGSSRQSLGGSNNSSPQVFTPSPNVSAHQSIPVGMATQNSRLPGSVPVMRGQITTPVRDVSLVSGTATRTFSKSYSFSHSGSVPILNNTSKSPLIHPSNSEQNISTLGVSNYSNAVQNKTQFNNQSTERALRPEGVRNQKSNHNTSISFHTTSNVLQCNDKPAVSITNNTDKSKWKFKSPPSRSSSVSASPNVSATCYQEPNIQKSLNNINSFNSGGNSRHCQLTKASMPSSSQSSVSIQGGKNGSGIVHHVSTDNLWEDDLSDEILSQLTDDF